jgi:HAD superfamily hydrolase (TIGR01549 family)
MIKAIIFDCFGVLYPDTYWAMASEYLGEKLDTKRQDLSSLVRQVDLGTITKDELWANFAELVDSNKESVYKRLKEFGGLDSRLLKFIEVKKSDYKIGMISNVGQGFIERMFVDKPASQYFDSLVLSSDVGLVKPDVRIYELSASQLGCRTDECVFIDDLEKNVNGAIDAGMQSFQYVNYEDFIEKMESIVNSA